MQITQGRIYAGETPAERDASRRARLIEAGLDVMGAGEVVTVRKVVDRSGLSPRYFYDHFADIEQLQLAVFEALTSEAEALALEAMHTGPRGAKNRTRGILAAMVDLLLDDPRKGRVLLIAPLASPVLAPRFTAELDRFAGLVGAFSPAARRGTNADPHAIQRTARFAMGGFASTMSAVIAAGGTADREALVDDLTTLFVAVGAAYNKLAPVQAR